MSEGSDISPQPTEMDLDHCSTNDHNVIAKSSAATQKEVVRLVVISDTHGYHKKLNSSLPKGDILIHLGDFCNKGSTSDALGFANWITKMASIPANQKHEPHHHPLYEEIIVLEGNHDRTLFSAQIKGTQPLDINMLFERVASDTDGKVQFLQDQMFQSRRYPSLRLYGASWNSCAGDNFPFQFDLMGQEPPDVMLAHINPYISPRITYPQLESVQHTRAWEGAERLSKTVIQNKIPLCMFGHVHWGRGVIHVPHANKENVATSRDITSTSSVFVNAATLKHHRNGGILNEPVVVDYDLVQRKPIRIHCPVL